MIKFNPGRANLRGPSVWSDLMAPSAPPAEPPVPVTPKEPAPPPTPERRPAPKPFERPDSDPSVRPCPKPGKDPFEVCRVNNTFGNN